MLNLGGQLTIIRVKYTVEHQSRHHAGACLARYERVKVKPSSCEGSVTDIPKTPDDASSGHISDQ